MRNTFDQYFQPENKLTHLSCCTLSHDKNLLLKPFPKWLGIQNIPPLNELTVVQHLIPGRKADEEQDEWMAAGHPDLMICDNEGWPDRQSETKGE